KLAEEGWRVLIIWECALRGRLRLSDVFVIIASIATFATVWVWLMILLSQVAMRRKLSTAEIKALDFPVFGWPYAPAFAIGFMVFILVMMGYFPDSRPAIYVGITWLALLTIAYR
ncbi:proline-specific permease ProY, partial [Klebsiella pneumoniae]